MGVMLRLVGYAVILFGLGMAGAMVMTNSGELQALFGVFALGGLAVVLIGGALLAIGALLGRGKVKASGPGLTPEQQQLLDAQEFQATRRDEQGADKSARSAWEHSNENYQEFGRNPASAGDRRSRPGNR
ncbi:MAG: hypothetical protein HY985_09905 [Magnetospirillum sp.]|nr:hypothetical protein [Magnetospirillum sp.]